MSNIFIDEYLWQATSESQLERLGKREPVSEKQLVLGQLSWTAFTAPTPELMLELMQECTSVLPFLQNALFRLFEEFSVEWSGLPRKEHCFRTSKSVESTSSSVCFLQFKQRNRPVLWGIGLFGNACAGS